MKNLDLFQIVLIIACIIILSFFINSNNKIIKNNIKSIYNNIDTIKANNQKQIKLVDSMKFVIHKTNNELNILRNYRELIEIENKKKQAKTIKELNEYKKILDSLNIAKNKLIKESNKFEF